MIKEQDLSTNQVSQSMNIGETATRRRLKQYKAEQDERLGIGAPLTTDHQRIRQLEQENPQLLIDVTLLKNALTPFARETKCATR